MPMRSTPTPTLDKVKDITIPQNSALSTQDPYQPPPTNSIIASTSCTKQHNAPVPSILPLKNQLKCAEEAPFSSMDALAALLEMIPTLPLQDAQPVVLF